MKSTQFICISLCFLCTACIINREYPVEYDYNFLSNYADYETFGFMEAKNEFDTTTNRLIKNTIKGHLELLGYHYEEESPKFLVTYFYYGDSLKYNGYRQPEMESFLKIKSEREKKKEGYNRQSFSIKDGTFVINFTDKRDYSMIWQGYTTDLYKDQILDDPRKTRIAIISILKNYNYLPEISSSK